MSAEFLDLAKEHMPANQVPLELAESAELEDIVKLAQDASPLQDRNSKEAVDAAKAVAAIVSRSSADSNLYVLRLISN